MKRGIITRFLVSLMLVICLQPESILALAASVTPGEITDLQAEIQNRKAQIETINTRLEGYRKKIADYSKLSSSLQTEIAILENESAMTELEVAATQNAIEEEQLHLSVVTVGIDQADARLAREKDLLTSLLFEINQQDKLGGTLEIFLGARNFNEVFSSASELASVNSDLRNTLATTKQTRNTLETKKLEREERLASLDELNIELEVQLSALAARVSAKEVLSLETHESELEYRVLLTELRQEQQGISQRINQLQQDIENKLIAADQGGGTTVISWPVMGRLTTTFHDPTYPFRYLFEHGGLDLAVPQGTPIGSAAPGYVAWAQTGRQYGNYVMIIHANGFATLYAHMSRIDVVADQFVARGQVIGLSGGRPGSQGAGFSTGPHVHFELRQGGLPIDPMPYLP